MDKVFLAKAILAQLEKEAATIAGAASSSFDAATDEESRAEGKYDTRSLETSYLAGGQAKLAVEAQQAVIQFKALPIKSFDPHDPIALSAYVEVETGGFTDAFFLSPCAGGAEFEWEGISVSILTPQSPMGRLLMGKKRGDTFRLNESSPNQSVITTVC